MSKSQSIFNNRIARSIGGVSTGLLIILLLALLFPRNFHEAANAEELNAIISTNTTAYIKSVVSVALNSQLDINIVPKVTGAFGYSVATLRVSTNNTSGYTVYLQTQDDSQQLKALDQQNHSTINAVNGKMTATDFAGNINTWGYANTTEVSPETAEYVAVPKSDNAAILHTDKTSSSDTYNLSFGVAVGTDLPAGGYSNKVVVSVVANPIQITNLMQLTHMQDMKPEICAGTATGATKQLIDARDGKSYWVAKMKDGKCWMLQNLDLDLNDTTLPLTAATTDLVGQNEWTPSQQTKTGEVNFVRDSKASWSYDPGMWVITEPQTISNCGNIGDGKRSLADCGNIFTKVDSWSPTFAANNGTTINSANNTYDAHYLVGNYYTWRAAVVGAGLDSDGNEIVGQNVDGSICPKGWRLSQGGLVDGARDYNNSDYAKLIRAEGYNQPYFTPDNDTTQRGINVTGAIPPVTSAPLYIFRAGYARLTEFVRGGSYGYSWQGTTALATGEQAMHLSLFENHLYPDYTYLAHRDLGFNVRCLAR